LPSAAFDGRTPVDRARCASLRAGWRRVKDMATALTSDPPARYELAPDDGSGTLRLVLSGGWILRSGMPAAEEVDRALAAHAPARRVMVDAAGLEGWDSGLMTFLLRLERLSAARQVTLDLGGLPEGASRLLRLAAAVPERPGARQSAAIDTLLVRVGRQTEAVARGAGDALEFLGETTLALGRLLCGQASFRRVDFLLVLQEVGARALPIVSLISFLVGVILAFLGAIQLVQFGAQIYVADLVVIGMAREMAAMMVGIILAGRTGAAFAAELGTMQVNEEIDALGTFGLSAIDFLVLPRILALVLMTPLLCLYADVMGILGGALIGVTMLDLPAATWFQETVAAARPTDFMGGLLKATVYGAIVAFAGCLRGLQGGRSSAAVGIATTSAVVTSIVLIVLAMALLTVVYHVLGI
jgi:phospholipid/cholesterol/gamma-HCH transport system permease protein